MGKLTPALLEAIRTNIAEGNYVEVTCKAAGISKTSFYEWKKRGEKARSGIYREFYEAIEAATAQSEQKYVGVIKDAANKGVWTAAAWWLERRYPERWGKRDKIDVTSGGKPIQPLDLNNLSDEELAILEKVIGGTNGKAAKSSGDSGGESQT